MKWKVRHALCLTWTAIVLGVPGVSFAQDLIGSRVSIEDLGALQTLTRDAPEDFAGLTVDEDAGRATVFMVESRYTPALKRLHERVQQRRSRVNEKLEIQYKVVARSQASLEKIKDSITLDQSWATQVGGQVAQWGVDPGRNTVFVGVTEVTPELERAARERFGDAVELIEAAPMTQASRLHDTAPFWGGSRISDGTNACSSGFAIFNQSSGQIGMLTAGHCGQPGAAMFQDGHTFGNLSIRTLVTNGLDRGVVTNGSYDSLIFTGSFPATGPFDSSSAERVRGFVLVAEGISVCVDGSSHGEICGCKIGKRDFCTAILGGGSTCHVTAVNKAGNIIIGGGDSGGPVFSRVSNGVTAVGTIIGNVTGHLDQGVIHELSFALPSGWQLLTR